MNYLEKHRTILVLIAMGLMLSVINLDLSATNLALAPISRDFHTKLSHLQWISNGFIIIAAALMIIAGRICDLFGKKRLFIVGGIIFILGSAIAGLAPNTTVLIYGRCIQGIGFAITFPLCIVLSFMAVPLEKRGFAIGFINGMSGLAQAVGPSVGGILIHYLSWRWIFLINIPIGLISLGMAWIACVQDTPSTQTKTLDYGGAILLFIPLLLLMYGLNEFHTINSNTILWLLFTIISASFMAFVIWEKYSISPLVDFNLFKNKNFVIVNVLRIITSFIFFALMFTIGLYLQNILSYSALQAGILLLLFSCLYGIVAPIVGKIADKVGTFILINLGFGITILALTNLFLYPVITVWWNCLLPFCLIGMSFGILLPCLALIALNTFGKEKIGIASGIFYTNACLGGGLGVGVAGTLLSHISLSRLHTFIITNNITLNPAQNTLLQHVVTGTETITKLKQYLPSDLYPIMLQQSKISFVHGFSSVILICLLLSIISLGCTWLLRKNIPKN